MSGITKAFMKKLNESGLENQYKGEGEDGSDMLSICNDVSNYPVLMAINDSSAHMLLCVTRLNVRSQGKLLNDINAMNRQSCYVTYVLDSNNVMIQSDVLYNDLTMVDNCMLFLANLLNGAGTYRCILDTIYGRE